MPNPAKWFLNFPAFGGEGRPWGDGTASAARQAQGVDPWDTGCTVTTHVGGYAAMTAMREVLEQTIADAKASANPRGQRGLVYFSGWRLNPQRELGDVFSAWTPSTPAKDQTAIGMILRLMQAGVRVRIMVWLPTVVQTQGAGKNHVEEHYYLAEAVEAEAQRLADAVPMGVVALDARTAEGSIAGSHHQKTMVVRGLTDHVAFCGGVDFAFTRRDAPATLPAPAAPAFLNGDWQSETGRPPWDPPIPWPRDSDTVYTAVLGLDRPTSPRDHDLPPISDGSLDIYGSLFQVWHDQHLELRGPIVGTLEDQFAERWKDTGDVFDLTEPGNTFGGQVIFSSATAIGDDGAIVPLPLSQAAPAAGGPSAVQMWRTIPLRDARTGPPFQRGEFTAMAGVSRAVTRATELIWMFDQYFWSMPLARQLNFELRNKAGLRLIVILPPFADTQPAVIHEARRRALTALADGVRAQVEVYGLWDPRTPGAGRGIYCHAKAHTYDGGLLVCGSANLNRRSFLCDSELACAVADEAVVLAHQQALWTLLFGRVTTPAGQWPAAVGDLDAVGSGATFFTAFQAAAADPRAFVRPDPWESATPALPNGVALPRGNLAADLLINHIFDPTSVDPAPLERKVDFRDAQGALQSRPPRLTDVVTRIEETRTKRGQTTMPNRRQSSWLPLPLLEVEPTFNDFAL